MVHGVDFSVLLKPQSDRWHIHGTYRQRMNLPTHRLQAPEPMMRMERYIQCSRSLNHFVAYENNSKHLNRAGLKRSGWFLSWRSC